MEQLSVEIVEDFTPRRTIPPPRIIHVTTAPVAPVVAAPAKPKRFAGMSPAPAIVAPPITVGYSVDTELPPLPSVTLNPKPAAPALRSFAITSNPPYSSGYAPYDTFPTLGQSYFATAGSTGGGGAPTDWYLYPALPVAPATGGAVLFEDASGQHVLESIDGNLFFDTELLAKASDIQDVADWALYPALADVDMNGQTMDTIGKLSFQPGTSGGAGLVENAQLISGDTNLPLDIAIKGTGTLNFLTNTTTRATMTAGGTFQFLTAAPQTAIAPTTGNDLTNRTYVDGQVTDLSGRIFNLQTEVTDISGRVGTLETGLFDVSGRVSILEQQIIDVSGNIANWSLYPAVSTINADDNDIDNVGSFTAGGVLNTFQLGTGPLPMAAANIRATLVDITGYSPVTQLQVTGLGGVRIEGTGGDVDITAPDVNISATGNTDILNITAVAGIAINAGAGVEIGAVGTIQILSTGNVSIGSGNVLGADTEVEKFAFKEEVMSKAGVNDLELEDIAKINGLAYVPTQSWATQVATADVDFTQPSIPLPIVHNIIGLGKINGTTYAPTSLWSSFPAGSTIDVASYPIIGVTTINGTTYTPGSSWSSFPATQNVSFGGFSITNCLDVSASSFHGLTVTAPTINTTTVNLGTGVLIKGDTTQLLTLQEQGSTSLAQLRTAAINFAADTTDTDTIFFKRMDGYVGVTQGALTSRVAYLSDVMQQIAASFSSDTTKTVTAANTPTQLTYTNTEYTKGGITYDVSGNITVPTAGAYEVLTSIQFDKSGGGVSTADFWFQVDGVDVPRSATQLVVAGTNGETVGTVSVFLDLTAGQKVSVQIASADATMAATAFPAITTPYVRPAVPSVITNVKMITDPDGTPVIAPSPSPGPITVSPGPALPTISMTQHVLTVAASTPAIASATLTLGPVADGIFSVAGFSLTQNGTITQTGLAVPKVVTWSDGTDWFLNASVSNSTSSAIESWKVNIMRVPATISATTNLITL